MKQIARLVVQKCGGRKVTRFPYGRGSTKLLVQDITITILHNQYFFLSNQGEKKKS